MVTVFWVVSRSRLKAPPGSSSPYISPLIPSGQRNCASWASQPQKSVTLPPQPGGGPRKFVWTCGGIRKKKSVRGSERSLDYGAWNVVTVFTIFTFVPGILILSQFFIHQLMHKWVALKNIKISIKIAPTCFGAVTPFSGSALSVLAKVTLVKIFNYATSVCD